MLPSRELTQQIPKVSCFYLYGKVENKAIFSIRKKTLLGPRPPWEWILKFFYATLNRERLLNNFPKFHASTYTWSWRIHDDSVFNIRKKLLLGPRPPVSVNLNILFTCYNHGSVLINYSEFHASTYTGNMRICDFLFLYSSF